MTTKANTGAATCPRKTLARPDRAGKRFIAGLVSHDLYEAFEALAKRKGFTKQQLFTMAVVTVLEDHFEPVPAGTREAIANPVDGRSAPRRTPGVRIGRPRKVKAPAHTEGVG